MMHFRQRTAIGNPKMIAKRERKYNQWRKKGKRNHFRKFARQQPKGKTQ